MVAIAIVNGIIFRFKPNELSQLNTFAIFQHKNYIYDRRLLIVKFHGKIQKEEKLMHLQSNQVHFFNLKIIMSMHTISN